MSNILNELRTLTSGSMFILYMFLLVGLLVVLGLDVNSTLADSAGSINLVPLNLFSSAFKKGMFFLSLGIVVTFILILILPYSLRFWSLLGLMLVLYGIALLLVSINPGSTPSYFRDSERNFARVSDEHVFIYPVYFPNSSTVLELDEQKSLNRVVKTFRNCEVGSLFVRGFASSRKFAGDKDSDYKNKNLANQRAVVLTQFLKSKDIETIPFVWETAEQMFNERRLRDRDINGLLVPEREQLNRRVEVYWNDSACQFSPFR